MVVTELKDAKLNQVSPGIRVKMLCGMNKETDFLLSGFMQWNPGEKSPRHYHPNCEELQYVIYGDGILRDCEGKEYPLRAGTIFYCPKGIEGAHQIDNSKSDTPLALIWIYPSNDREIVKLVKYGEENK